MSGFCGALARVLRFTPPGQRNTTKRFYLGTIKFCFSKHHCDGRVKEKLNKKA